MGHAFADVLSIALPVARENGANRIAGDDADLWIFFLEKTTDAGNGAASSSSSNEVGDAAFGLIPQLRTSQVIVSLRIRVVVKLVGEDRVGRFFRDSLRHHHVTVGMVGRHCRWSD